MLSKDRTPIFTLISSGSWTAISEDIKLFFCLQFWIPSAMCMLQRRSSTYQEKNTWLVCFNSFFVQKILFTNSIDAINTIHRNSLQSMQTFKVSCKAKIQKLLAFSARKPSSIIYIGILTTKVEESFITFYFFS